MKYAFAHRFSYLVLNDLKVLLIATQPIDKWLFIAKHPLKPKSDKAKTKLASTMAMTRKKQKPECKLFGSHSGFS